MLLEYENVQPSDDEVRAMVPAAPKLWVFHGPHQRQVAERFASFGNDLAIVPISKRGKNALDFHLSFYMGYIAARHPQARFVVLANDKGYMSRRWSTHASWTSTCRPSACRVAGGRAAPARKTEPKPATNTTTRTATKQAARPVPKPAP
ncbi:MAG: hypothetical protein IPM99_12810 [Rubrivivax sp.]|nr:hypothetical protein [Rubrivivax sp.]